MIIKILRRLFLKFGYTIVLNASYERLQNNKNTYLKIRKLKKIERILRRHNRKLRKDNKMLRDKVLVLNCEIEDKDKKIDIMLNETLEYIYFKDEN